MTTDPIECQHHRNCGGHCETPEEIEMDLCESCLDSYHEQEREAEENSAIRAALQAIAVAAGIKAPPAEIARIVCAKLSEND
jgi:hypothetical protein